MSESTRRLYSVLKGRALAPERIILSRELASEVYTDSINDKVPAEFGSIFTMPLRINAKLPAMLVVITGGDGSVELVDISEVT